MKPKLFESDAFGRSIAEIRSKYDQWVSSPVRDSKKAYDRFFSGYETEQIIDKHGKKKFIRMYKGDLFVQEVDKQQAIRIRVAYGVLTVLSFCLFLWGLILNVDSNRCWYVMLLSFVPLIFYVRLFFAVGLYILAPREMKVREYRDGALRIMSDSRIMCYTIPLSIVGSAVMILVTPKSFVAGEVWRAVLHLAAAGLILAIKFWETKVKYTVVSPKGENNNA